MKYDLGGNDKFKVDINGKLNYTFMFGPKETDTFIYLTILLTQNKIVVLIATKTNIFAVFLKLHFLTRE